MLLIPGIIGSAAPQPGDFESIATLSVGSGGAANVEFTSIPSSYQHLQIRILGLTDSALTNIAFQFNNSTSSIYAVHQLYGEGSTVGSNGGGDEIRGAVGITAGTTTSPSAAVVDILDYKDTNKYKTARILNGYDANGSGWIQLRSALWQSTNAITSIKFFPVSGNFRQYTHFALYGIKG